MASHSFNNSTIGISPTDKVTLLDERQVAELLCISPATLRKWRVRGDGPPFTKLSRLVRYEQRDVLEFIANGLRSSTSGGAVIAATKLAHK